MGNKNFLDLCRKEGMKMMSKKKVAIVVIVMLLALFIYLFLNSQKSAEPHVVAIQNNTTIQTVGDYLSESDLLSKAPYILQGKVKSISESFDYEGISFVKINFEIRESIYSINSLDKEVTILRENEMFTPLEEGHDYILYLYDYEGSIASDVKMICGGNIGAYELISDDNSNHNVSLTSYKNRIKEEVQKRK